MADLPLFSILLPTKNRSHLVPLAVRSVLGQDLADFELVVCDNDDDPRATRDALEPFFADARIRYVRTGGLDMVSNWRRALDEAHGRYVTVLEDKMILYPGALARIHEAIGRSSSEVVVWGRDVMDDTGGTVLLQYRAGAETLVDSGDMLARVTTDVQKYWQQLPRGLCCAVPRRLMDAIAERGGRPFYEAVSPDFVAAAKVLASIDRYLLLTESLTLIISNKVSTGKSNLKGRDVDLSYYKGKSELLMTLEHVPLDNFRLVSNNVINDYRRLSLEFGGRLLDYPVSRGCYVAMVARELTLRGVAARVPSQVLPELARLWRVDGAFGSNALSMARAVTCALFGLVLKKVGLGSEAKAERTPLAGDPLQWVEAFLDGRESLGRVQPFTTGAAASEKEEGH